MRKLIIFPLLLALSACIGGSDDEPTDEGTTPPGGTDTVPDSGKWDKASWDELTWQ